MLPGSRRIRLLGAGLVWVLVTGGTVAVTGGPAGAVAPRPKVDLVFAIDSTGSMGPYIDQVQRSARGITDLLFARADARVALVDYKDLHADCPADGYAARVDLAFTATAAAFGPSVGGLAATGGCDQPESVYSGIMTGLAQPWRPDARRALIVMGDAPPHDPEATTGYTRAAVTATATAGGVTVVPPAARSLRPAVAASPVSLHAVDINGGASPAFEDLAEDTGGRSYPATDPTGALEQIAEAITEITGGGLTADAGGPYVGAAGEPVTFTATTAGGSNRVGGYDWDLDGDGRYDVTTGDPTFTRTYRKPVTLTIGLRAHTDVDPNEVATDTAQVRRHRPRLPPRHHHRGIPDQGAQAHAHPDLHPEPHQLLTVNPTVILRR